jgi:uncharacterized membrane protein
MEGATMSGRLAAAAILGKQVQLATNAAVPDPAVLAPTSLPLNTMGRWLEHSVTTEINAPVEQVWAVWSDLEAMPRWMRWIESVVTEPNNPDLTDWTLSAQGFRFHWKAGSPSGWKPNSCIGNRWVACPPREVCASIPRWMAARR